MDKVFDGIKIDELLNKQHNDLSNRIGKWTFEDFGLSFHSIS